MSLRRRVFYQGRVQGVGFRMTVRRLASAFPVTGFVKNLDDGRVELVVEGDSTSVRNYLRAILCEFDEFIRNVEEIDENAGDEPLVGFSIRD